MEEKNHIVSINMTNLFKRSLMLYSFGDIKLSKPIPLKTVAYTIGFLFIWTLPFFLAFGLPSNPYMLIIYVVPPIGLGQLAVRPIFGGKTLLDYSITAFRFLGEPKGWADGKPFNIQQQNYKIEYQTWISRRREYAMLADMIDKEGKK